MSRIKNKLKKRQMLLTRDGEQCHICKLPFTESRPPTFDHIIEAKDGGKSSLDNLKLAHESCNSKRSNKPEALPAVRQQAIAHIYGTVPFMYVNDPKGVQPVRIVDVEEAPTCYSPFIPLGLQPQSRLWFWGRYP